jgi:hypothetical protein
MSDRTTNRGTWTTAWLIAALAIMPALVGCQARRPAAAQPGGPSDVQYVGPEGAPAPQYITPPQADAAGATAADEIDIRGLDPVAAARMSDGMAGQTPPPRDGDMLDIAPPPAPAVRSAPDASPATEAASPSRPALSREADQFIRVIEKAHGASRWARRAAFEAYLEVDFGGKDVIDGWLLMDTAAHRSRLKLRDGTVAVFDGQAAWVTPASVDIPRARFHLLTWPYFIAVPFKLRDEGAILQVMEAQPLGDRPFPAARLTFAPGTGDSPDDWYVIYRDPATGWVRALAYIVTYDQTVEEAQKTPHAVVYDDYVQIEGAIIPRRWTFYNWSPLRGVEGDPIGQVRLSGLRFVRPEPDAFSAPEDARPVAGPEAAGPRP